MGGARYREYRPGPELRRYVRSLFTFTHEPRDEGPPPGLIRESEASWSALYADSGVSVVFCFGEGYRIDELWQPCRGRAHVIGPMTAFRSTSPGVGLLEVGAYLHPECASFLLGLPAREISDRVVGLDLLWAESGRIEEEIAGCTQDVSRVAVLEAALMHRLKPGPISVAVPAARAARELGGRATVESLAESAGVSRQFLCRMFREHLGVSPNVYLRLCRFRRALTAVGPNSDWADTACDCGYFDQSHMIAEFRRFSGTTPGAMASQGRFHPFLAG